MPVGHGLISCTAKTQHFMIHHPNNPGRRIVLVDTPGLDQTYVDDEVIFTDIAVWLAQSWVCSPDTCHGYSSLGRYRKGMKIAGIIYLHEICERRLSGASRKNLRQFHEFCGDDVLKNVILVTTKWDEVELDMGPQRERHSSTRTAQNDCPRVAGSSIYEHTGLCLGYRRPHSQPRPH